MTRKVLPFLLIPFLLAGAAGALTLCRFFSSWDRLQAAFVSEVEKNLNARLTVEAVRPAFHVFPALKARKVHLESAAGEFPVISAEEAQFNFQLLPLLWGKMKISGMKVLGGRTRLGETTLERMDLKIRGLGRKSPASFELKSTQEDGAPAFKVKGRVQFLETGEALWRSSSFKITTTVFPFSFVHGKEHPLFSRLPAALRSGLWQGSAELVKNRDQSTVLVQARWAAKDFHSGTLTGESRFSWDQEKNSVEISRSLLKAPMGEFQGSAVLNLETGEIKGARIAARQLSFEEIIRHFPEMDNFLPVDTGVSGVSEFDLTLEGTWDYLSIHANWNLTPAVLTYGKVFSKAKDFPMTVNFDFLLKEGVDLSGDFSVRIAETTTQGAVGSADLKSGEGEITLLTNKFDLSRWSGLVPLLNEYTLSGYGKILLSLKGNLGQLKQTEKMLNLSLENVTLLSSGKKGFQELSAQIDWSPLNLRVKDASLKLADIPLELEAEIYNLAESPQGKFRLYSPALELFTFLELIREQAAFFPGLAEFIPSVSRDRENALKRFFPKPVLLEDFTLKGAVQARRWILEGLEFRLLDGSVRLSGEIESSASPPGVRGELQIDQISLSRYFKDMLEAPRALEGSLFFVGKFERADPWTGEGTVSITNGEWRDFDLFSPLKRHDVFKAVSQKNSPDLPFSDLKSTWSLKDGKFGTEDLVIHSDDFWADGKGNISTEGHLNGRLDVYLSKPLTRELFKSWEDESAAGERRLGPVPYLIVGTLQNPELKMEETAAAGLLEAIRARRYRKILSDPFAN